MSERAETASGERYQTFHMGPDQFAEALLELVPPGSSQLPGGFQVPFSRSSLKELIRLVYGVSLLPEEGRYPRLRLIFGASEPKRFPFDRIAEFQIPLRLDSVHELRKLAPALADSRCALWVAESKGGEPSLQCMGIVDADRLSSHANVGTLRSQNHGTQAIKGGATYVWLRAEGPGDLRAGFAPLQPQLILRGGQLVRTALLSGLPVFPYEQAGDGPLAHEYTEEMRYACSNVLINVISKRHGGAFLILPDARDSASHVRDDYQLSGGYEIRLDFAKHVLDYMASCEEVLLLNKSCRPVDSNVETPECRTLSACCRADLMRRQLEVVERALAELASVDGCVVLDKRMKVHLFGAKIARTDAKPLPLHPFPGTDIEAGIAKLGTRNQSALMFCQQHPGAKAFVVSQDGDLRVYWSSQDQAHVALAVDPRVVY